MHRRAGAKRMVCLLQTHHPFAPNTSSVSFKRIIRFPQTYYPFVFPFFMLLPLLFLFLSAPLPFFFGLSGRYTIVYLSSYYLYCVRLLVVGVVVGPVQVADNKRNRVAIWVSVLWL